MRWAMSTTDSWGKINKIWCLIESKERDDFDGEQHRFLKFLLPFDQQHNGT